MNVANCARKVSARMCSHSRAAIIIKILLHNLSSWIQNSSPTTIPNSCCPATPILRTHSEQSLAPQDLHPSQQAPHDPVEAPQPPPRALLCERAPPAGTCRVRAWCASTGDPIDTLTERAGTEPQKCGADQIHSRPEESDGHHARQEVRVDVCMRGLFWAGLGAVGPRWVSAM